MTRVHASDGALVAEYAQGAPALSADPGGAEARHQRVPRGRGQELLRAWRLDFTGIGARRLLYVQNFGSNRRPQGASTITQQVAKNFLLTNEVSLDRKIKEALLALRIERTYSKDKILELYLNEIYLGLGAYGIAAASLVYFDKSVNELTVAEAAYLAALPKAPATLHPVRNRDRAIERRNYVVDRMVENGWIKQADADKAARNRSPSRRGDGAHIFAGGVFCRGSPPRLYRALRREEAL